MATFKIHTGPFYVVLAEILALFVAVSYFHIDNIGTSIFSALFLSVVPGFLIYKILLRNSPNSFTTLLYSVGLSISFLMFVGLACNTLLPLFGVAQPLAFMPLFITISLILTVLVCVSYLLDEKSALVVGVKVKDLLFALPMLASLALSIFGAIQLNNNGSNILTAVSLVIIALTVCLFVMYKKDIPDGSYAVSIFLIGLSVLFMVSLRSWHITGWDINQELEVFQITKMFGHWSMQNIANDYNACLSITILPTILSHFVSFSDEYIFKVVFQMYFALVPVAMYALFRRLQADRAVAFLAVFYFIAQPFFVQPMPALIRQETAFLFFGLFLLTLYDALPKFQKQLLLFIFGVSMVVSHYSTSYIAIAYFLTAYILLKEIDILVYISKRFPNNIGKLFQPHALIQKNLTLKIILFLLITSLWYPLLTNSSNNPINAIKEAEQNISKSFSLDLKSNDVAKSLSIFSSPENRNVQKDIDAYINPDIQNGDPQKYYPPETYQDYKPTAIPQSVVKPLVDTGHNGLLITGLDLIKLLTKLLVLFGSLYFIFGSFYSKHYHHEMPLIMLSALMSIVVIMVVPELSIKYNLTRLYMQGLILLVLPATLGGLAFFKLLTKRFALACVTGVFVVYFLYMSGFLTNILGGQAYFQMHNFGDDYEKFYTYQQEVSGAEWLAQNKEPASPVFADEVSGLRLYSFGHINDVNNYLVPKAITKDAYVYVRYQNILRERTDVSYLGKLIIFYSFPFDFLNKNKDLIYNNGGTQIFR